MLVHPGLCRTCSETPNTRFLATRTVNRFRKSLLATRIIAIATLSFQTTSMKPVTRQCQCRPVGPWSRTPQSINFSLFLVSIITINNKFWTQTCAKQSHVRSIVWGGLCCLDIGFRHKVPPRLGTITTIRLFFVTVVTVGYSCLVLSCKHVRVMYTPLHPTFI